MARGAFSGAIVGTVVVGIGLVALSVIYRDVGPVGTPAPAPEPEAVSEAPDGPGEPEGGEEAAPAIGGADAGLPGGTIAPDAAGAPGAPESMPAVTDGLAMPETGAAPDGMMPAGTSEATPEITPGVADMGAAPDRTAPADGSGLPARETGVRTGETPAAPAVQSAPVQVGEVPAGGESPAMPGAEAGPEPAAQLAQGASAPESEAAPALQTGPTTPEVQATTQSVGAAPDAPVGPEMRTATAEPGLILPGAPGEVTPGEAEQPPPPDFAPASDSAAPPPPESASAWVPGTPAGQIGDLASNVVTGRLPAIGRETTAPAAADTPETVAAVPAIERNAVAFENPEGRPVMAVLLVDDGPARRDLGDLKNLPFPVSFAVDASARDAEEAIAFYRGAGAEVVLLVPLPDWAAPEDVEITLQAYAPLLDQAVAVMIPGASGFQTMGDAARQLAVVLSETGHGLISLPQGLNTGHKSAIKQGVPAGLVFREIDNDGQSVAVMRRFLDNAAFKAGLQPGVIVLGHARPDTIRALIEWSLGNRAKTVALAPISTVLLQEK